jgi:hypothetical protein
MAQATTSTTQREQEALHAAVAAMHKTLDETLVHESAATLT